MLNTRRAPFNDLRVRQAMAYATDSSSWAKAAGVDPAQHRHRSVRTRVEVVHPGGLPEVRPGQGQALVKATQAEHGPVTFTLQCTTDTIVAQTCQILQAQWEKAGMERKIVNTDENTLISNAIGGNYQATIWRQFGEQDPDADYDLVERRQHQAAAGPQHGPQRRSDDRCRHLRSGAPATTRRAHSWPTSPWPAQLAIDLPYIWIDHTVWVVAAQNSVRGLDRATFPDGSAAAPIVSGTQSLGQVWLTG